MSKKNVVVIVIVIAWANFYDYEPKKVWILAWNQNLQKLWLALLLKVDYLLQKKLFGYLLQKKIFEMLKFGGVNLIFILIFNFNKIEQLDFMNKLNN